MTFHRIAENASKALLDIARPTMNDDYNVTWSSLLSAPPFFRTAFLRHAGAYAYLSCEGSPEERFGVEDEKAALAIAGIVRRCFVP